MLKINIEDYKPDALDSKPLTGQRTSPVGPGAEDSDHQSSLSEEAKSADKLSFQSTFTKLREIILPMLHSLLSSKESESKAGGLNILGSFCGLSYDFTGAKINKHLQFLQRNSRFVILTIWELVYQLQDDWDVTIKEASVVLVQLCAPRNAV